MTPKNVQKCKKQLRWLFFRSQKTSFSTSCVFAFLAQNGHQNFFKSWENHVKNDTWNEVEKTSTKYVKSDAVRLVKNEFSIERVVKNHENQRWIECDFFCVFRNVRMFLRRGGPLPRQKNTKTTCLQKFNESRSYSRSSLGLIRLRHFFVCFATLKSTDKNGSHCCRNVKKTKKESQSNLP